MPTKRNKIERLIFASRWLLAPFFIGLIFTVGALIIKFYINMYRLLTHAHTYSSSETVVAVLTLVDKTLLGVLLIIVAFSGYETFVSNLSLDKHRTKPAWMARVSFTELKIKLIGAIVAIASVELLKVFIHSEDFTSEALYWKVALHMALVVTGLLFAVSDYVSSKRSLGGPDVDKDH